MTLTVLIVPLSALGVSLLSFYFAVKSWRQSNRPLVTARVSSLGMGGNVAVPLSIVVENTGNRPAKNIQLTVDHKKLDSVLTASPLDSLRRQVKACFSREGIIPVLANGKSISNSFGVLSDDGKGTWRGDPRFEIEISYQDLDGRRFKNSLPLVVGEDAGFAGGFWT